MKTRPGMDIQKCYRILNVKKGADFSEIKKSFHQLAREYHPDRNKGSRVSEERFKEISQAYETLERWIQSRQFAYRVYSHAFPVKDQVTLSLDGRFKAFAFLPERINQFLSRCTIKIWGWLLRHEKRWLELNVEKVVTLDPETASQGGILKIKNSAGSFHVHVPRDTSNETVLRIPGKGDFGFFNRMSGDLLLKIKIDHGRPNSPGVTEYFHQVTIAKDRLAGSKIRTLETHEGPIKYILPEKVRDGQSFVLKSRSGSSGGKESRHILVVNLV